MNRLTVQLTEQETRDLIRLGDLAADHSLSLHGQTALARITARLRRRIEHTDDRAETAYQVRAGRPTLGRTP